MKLENRFTVPVPVDEAWKVLLDVERIAPCMPGATLTSIDGDEFEGKVKVKVGPINLTYGGKARFVSKDDNAHVAVIDGSGKETRGTGTAKALITCRLVDKGDTTDVEVDTDLNVTGKPAQFGRGVLADVSSKLVDAFAACLSDEIQSGMPTGEAAAAPVEPETVASGGVDAAVAGAPEAADAEATAPVAAAAGASGVAPEGAPAAGTSGAMPGAAPAPGASGTAPAAAGASGTARPAAAPAASSGPRPVSPRPSAEAIDLLGTAGAPVLKRLAPVLGGLAVLALLVRWLRR